MWEKIGKIPVFPSGMWDAPRELVEAATPYVLRDIKSGKLTKEQNLSLITHKNSPKELVDAAMNSGVSYKELADAVNKSYTLGPEQLGKIDAKHIREIYPDLEYGAKARVLRYSKDEKLMDAAIKRLPSMVSNNVEREWIEINAYHNENLTSSQKRQLASNNKIVASLVKVDEIKKVEPNIEDIAFSESANNSTGFVELQFNPDIIKKYALSKDDVNAMLKRKHDQWRSNMQFNESKGKYTFDKYYN